MAQNTTNKWTADTRLDSLGLPFIDVILTERFLLPPIQLKKIGEEVPDTFADISRLSGMTLDEISAVMDECIALGNNIWMDVNDLTAETSVDGTILLDMRPDVSFETDPLHDHARLFHLENPARFIPFLRICKRVFVISNSESHAWSAAMALRKMSINAFLPRYV